jgi:hypothetical protein
LLLVQAVKGDDARMELARRLEHHYAKSRVADAEQPLVRVDSDGPRKGLDTVWYDRGGWAFWMLMEAMGRGEMFAGLHAFISTYRENPDHPTMHDLFAVLRPHAKDVAAFDACVAQWFEAVTLPRFEVASATKSPDGAGFRVRGRVRNAGTGDIEVDVAAVRGERSHASDVDASPYQQEKARVRLGPGGAADFEISTAFDPERVLVDPDVMVLQLGRKGATARLTRE